MEKGKKAQKIRLTERQKQTVEYMMEGLLVKQIADKMGVSQRTVKAFRGQVMERFGAKTASELIAKYLSQNLCH